MHMHTAPTRPLMSLAPVIRAHIYLAHAMRSFARMTFLYRPLPLPCFGFDSREGNCRAVREGWARGSVIILSLSACQTDRKRI